jgi:acid phosphatase
MADPRLVEFPPNCRTGDLLIEGMIQQEKLGEFFHDYLVKNLSFLPEVLDTGLVYVRCDHQQRTLDSATAFMQGLWPPQTYNEILTIESGGLSMDFFEPSSGSCADLRKLYDEYADSPEFINFTASIRTVVDPIVKYFNSSIGSSCDSALARWCNEGSLGPDIQNQTEVDEIMDTCRRYFGLEQFGAYKTNPGVAASPAMRELFRLMDSALGGRKSFRFALLSSHDTTVASLLTMIGHVEEYYPPFASWIAFEVWDDRKIGDLMLRVVYNSKVVNVTGGPGYMKLSDFRTQLGPLMKYCPEFP